MGTSMIFQISSKNLIAQVKLIEASKSRILGLATAGLVTSFLTMIAPEANAMEVCNDTNHNVSTLLLMETSTPMGGGLQSFNINYLVNGYWNISPGQCMHNLPNANWIYGAWINSERPTRNGIINDRRLTACILRSEYNNVNLDHDLINRNNCPEGFRRIEFLSTRIPEAGQVLSIGYNSEIQILTTRVQYDERSNHFQFQELADHFSWCIWHEGVRVYDDSFPGRMRSASVVRDECYAKQRNSSSARLQLRMASDQTLTSIMSQVSRNVGSGDLIEHFKWVAYHEGQAGRFRQYLAQGNFNGIRSAYYSEQSHDPNARNLLSAVSNDYIRWLIESHL